MLGVRPEYVTLAQAGEGGAIPVTVKQMQDIGTYRLLTGQVGQHIVRAKLPIDQPAPSAGAQVWLQVGGNHACLYRNEELVA